MGSTLDSLDAEIERLRGEVEWCNQQMAEHFSDIDDLTQRRDSYQRELDDAESMRDVVARDDESEEA